MELHYFQLVQNTNKDEFFTKEEIATLILQDKAFLQAAIIHLAMYGKLRSKTHQLRMHAAANVYLSNQILTKEQEAYFTRVTPYDNCPFLSLYWRQLQLLINKFQHPTHVIQLEVRRERHVRQGNSSGCGILLYKAAEKKELDTIDNMTILKAKQILNM